MYYLYYFLSVASALGALALTVLALRKIRAKQPVRGGDAFWLASLLCLLAITGVTTPRLITERLIMANAPVGGLPNWNLVFLTGLGVVLAWFVSPPSWPPFADSRTSDAEAFNDKQEQEKCR